MHRLIKTAAAATLGLAALGLASTAQAAVPDQVWLAGVSNGISGSTTSNTLTFSDGSTATQTLTARTGNQCSPGGQQDTPAGESNPYYTPGVPAGTRFETMGCAGQASFTTEVAFAKPVTNLRLHVVNLDGSRLTIGGTSTTGAPIGVQKVSGNNALTVSGNTINPTPLGVGYTGCETNAGSHRYGQCGTLVLTTSSGAIESFTLNNVSVVGNDGWALSYSFPAPPTADDDTANTTADTPVQIDPVDNDTPGASADLDPTTVRLMDGSDPVTELVTSDGTYTVDTTTGEVTFTPAEGFIGTAGPVTYQVADADGSIATATITVTVAPAVGVPMADAGVGSGIVIILAAGGGVLLWLRRRRVAA